MTEVREKGKAAKEASFVLMRVTTQEKNEALRLIAEQLVLDQERILAENQRDLEAGKKKGISPAILDRIMLNTQRVNGMIDSIYQLVELNDPIGEVLESIEKENGLHIQKQRVPIGVIGMIYEARPNVTIDAATLTLKAGNAVILRGSSSAKYSNMALVQSIHDALKKSKLPVNTVQLIEDTSRDSAKELFQLNEYLDVLIPRGGKNLIDTVVKEATVPVIETGAGNCHVFIDESAKQEMAIEIVLNAKLQRPSVCNAIESVIIHKGWFTEHGEKLLQALRDNGVQIVGDKSVCEVLPEAERATEEAWSTEYLGLSISVKVVSSSSDAIQHINKYGTKHSEAIITENDEHAKQFMLGIDAAAVYHNASTRFTDGFEFGYGAEIGISTQKLHARGPMGLQAMTSSKFVIHGNGQIRN